MRIEHTISFSNSGCVKISAYDDNNNIVGMISFYRTGLNKLVSGWTYVDPDFRNQKLASRMYLHAHSLGYKIKPSPLQTPEGKLMWAAFKRADLPFTRKTWFQKLLGPLAQ